MNDSSFATGLEGKRVVFVVAGEVLGGAERNAIDLAARFQSLDRAHVVICSLDDTPGRARAVAAKAGVPWISVNTPWIGGRSAKLASLARLTRALRGLRPDVLLPCTNLPNVACGLTWPATGASLCVWTQTDVLGTRRFSQRLFRRALHAAPLVMTTAFHAKDWIADQWGFDPQRIYVIRSEVQLAPAHENRASWRARLGLRETDLAACMVAHLHAGKDHGTLLHAWQLVVNILKDEGRNAVLLLAGRAAGREHDLKGLAFDLGLRGHVRFLGDVDDIGGLLGAVDLAVFSSRSECLGRGATEPMLAGLPVAGTDIPGIREAVGDHGQAFLAKPGDHSGLADVILRLAGDPAMRVRVGRANAVLIRTRQSEKMTSRLFARLLEDALARRLQAAVPGKIAATAGPTLSAR